MEEDIYGDLENYNEINALDELRKENQELKYKVEEYASTIARLQMNILQDLDKVNLEFKTMTINFSSLLKTARAEIERKTQIINNLNLEKDKLVFSTLQNNNRNILNIKKNLVRGRSLSRNKRDSEGCKLSRDYSETSKVDADTGRKDDNRLPSIETVSSVNTEQSDKIANIDKSNSKKSVYRTDESKENMSDFKPKSQSIRNRRKSMPALIKPKFSSDEEDNSNEETNSKEWYLKDDKHRKIVEIPYSDRSYHKTSETSGIDEKYSSYHESSRDTYYRESFGSMHDRYRHQRDKKEPHLRQKRLLSPEYLNKRVPKEHFSERSRNSDSGRHRRSESPPLQKHNSYHRNRSRERRPVERERYDRSRSRHDRYSYKHRLHDYEEPLAKRARTNSMSHQFEEIHDVKNGLEETNKPKNLEIIHNLSCQSPDLTNYMSETVPVKEIMNTAATPLEDPRLSSNRYIKENQNDKVVVTAVSSKTLGLFPIHTAEWKIHRVQMPDALRQPPNDTDRLVQELYGDIDPVRSASVESGEIQSDIVNQSDYNTDEIQSIHHKIENSEQVNNKESIPLKVTQPQEATIKSSQYKIPKIKKLDKIPEQSTSNPLGKLLSDFNINTPPVDSLKNNVKLNVDAFYSPEKDNTRNEPEIHKSEVLNKIKKSMQELVEGDLELSDETSDNIDVISKRKSKSHEKRKSVENTKHDAVSKNKTNERKNKPITLKIAKDKNTQYRIEQKTEDNNKIIPESNKINNKSNKSISESSTKQKTKKKSHKDKRNSQESQTPTDVDAKDEKRSSKSKKGSKPKEIKSKFSDLFGESSSLISPEDLGVITKNVDSQSSSKYLSILEDAQDAIDMSLTPVKSDFVFSSNIPDDVNYSKTENPKSKTPNTKNIEENKNYEPDKGTLHKSNCITVQEKSDAFINLNPGSLVPEADVVNTVIISTGVQPQVISGEINSIPFLDCNAAENVDNTDKNEVNSAVTSRGESHVVARPFEDCSLSRKVENTCNNAEVFKSIVTPGALATSTPQKSTSSCTSNDSKVSRNESVERLCQSNGVDTEDQGDIPDVRIFVKRRRKVLKKAVSK